MHHLGNSYEPRVPRFLDDSWLEYLDEYSKTPKSLTHASNWTDSNHAKQQDYGNEDPWHPLVGFFETLVPEFSPKRKTTGTWDNITAKGKGETSTNHQFLASMLFSGVYIWMILVDGSEIQLTKMKGLWFLSLGCSFVTGTPFYQPTSFPTQSLSKWSPISDQNALAVSTTRYMSRRRRSQPSQHSNGNHWEYVLIGQCFSKGKVWYPWKSTRNVFFTMYLPTQWVKKKGHNKGEDLGEQKTAWTNSLPSLGLTLESMTFSPSTFTSLEGDRFISPKLA